EVGPVGGRIVTEIGLLRPRGEPSICLPHEADVSLIIFACIKGDHFERRGRTLSLQGQTPDSYRVERVEKKITDLHYRSSFEDLAHELGGQFCIAIGELDAHGLAILQWQLMAQFVAEVTLVPNAAHRRNEIPIALVGPASHHAIVAVL